MPTEPYLPEDPLERFIELADAVERRRRWTRSRSMLRLAAQGLVTAPGSAAELAARLYELGDRIRAASSWFSGLRTDARFCLAAGLLRHGIEAPRFLETHAALRRHFRAERLPRGELYEALACLVLMGAGSTPGREEARRLAAIFHGMKRHHRFVTGRDDYPAAAMLAASGAAPEEIVARTERMYEALRGQGYRRGDRLQLASHLLHFAGGGPDALARRFRELYEAFRRSGLRMNAGDYDEVASLCFLDRPADVVTRRVLADRDAIRARLRPRSSRQESFTLACCTALLALIGAERDHRPVTEALQLAQMIALLQAQQAVVAAGAAAAGGGAAAAG